MPTRLRHFAAAASLLALAPTGARALDSSPVAPAIDARVAALEGTLVEWRRHLHEHPELSNREVETERYVAERLRAMGLSPRTGIAGHGVVAVIEGRLPGATVALRSDMDALPVAEEVDLPFASRATGTFEERTVPVMHACGHDAHMSMLLVAAEALVAVRDRLPGRVVLLFQPAEEGVPIEEQPAGAEAMVRDGVLDDPKVDAVFGLHVFAGMTSGVIGYRPGPALAAADRFEIVVEGKQAHGSKPWAGVDPIVAASEIVGALQTIVSRQIDLTKEPAVVSVGQFESGVRNNIIPDRARLVGTIRTFDEAMRDEIHARLRRIAENVAEAQGARAEVTIERGYPVTVNDPALTREMLPTLERVAPGQVREVGKITGAEDFAFYAQRVPGLFLSLGITPAGEESHAASNHSPRFFVDESALPVGARALAQLAADWLFAAAGR
ncbi:MAG: amidohydrolase [Acidobacteria bacterium]|nr:amidohydrolase [Acidobacteriota bacterium]MCB9378138.1 amidohydrolase [Holophagales bacterium]